jgi:hypothetical protein
LPKENSFSNNFAKDKKIRDEISNRYKDLLEKPIQPDDYKPKTAEKGQHYKKLAMKSMGINYNLVGMESNDKFKVRLSSKEQQQNDTFTSLGGSRTSKRIPVLNDSSKRYKVRRERLNGVLQFPSKSITQEPDENA